MTESQQTQLSLSGDDDDDNSVTHTVLTLRQG